MLSKLMFPFTSIMKKTVGDYKNMKVSFEMDKNKSPYHSKPYRIPVTQINLMKRAINEIVKNKTLSEYNGHSPWAVPTFGMPKKNDGVRIVSYFRKLNEAIKRNPWSIQYITRTIPVPHSTIFLNKQKHANHYTINSTIVL